MEFTSGLAVRACGLIARLHVEGALSEGQCINALRLDRVEFRAMCDEFQNAIADGPTGCMDDQRTGTIEQWQMAADRLALQDEENQERAG